MSMPVKYCHLVEAMDSQDTFDKMHLIMKQNLDGGHFTMIECTCDPLCRDVTGLQMKELFDKFRNQDVVRKT